MNDGGPAFPCRNDQAVSCGMTLRDYFAAAALNGMLCACESDNMDLTLDDYCSDAYRFADALLREREKQA